MWRTHSQHPFIRADKISLPTTTTSPFHYTCNSECPCSTASQWDKCNIDDLMSEVLDPFCSPTDQVHSSPVCSVQEDWWSAIYQFEPPPLVKSRVSLSDPFTITGVDFTGALYVRTTEGESKVYLCLFTCAVSRAIHLEIVTDLTVECFLQAFADLPGKDPCLRCYSQIMVRPSWQQRWNLHTYFRLMNFQKGWHTRVLSGNLSPNVPRGVGNFGNHW